MSQPKVFILDTFNPLAGSLKDVITGTGNMLLTEHLHQAEVIISFAYHSEDDVVEMKTMAKVVNEYSGKKIIFLSWFHPLSDFSKYSHLFSPEKPTCVLMNISRYRILQLPATGKDIIDCISLLSIE